MLLKQRRIEKGQPSVLVCDALLNQEIFAGVGNIYYDMKYYFAFTFILKSIIGKLPSKKLAELNKRSRNYSFNFLKWKKEFVLK
jgi:endonuclease-8